MLLGRNTFSLLELHHKQASHRQGLPGWVKEPGALMGPGACMGANLLAGEWKGRHAGSQAWVDVMCNYDQSPLHMKRFRRLIQQERVALL